MTKEQTLKKIICKYESLEALCETLDSCHDLFDLGYIDSQEEQDIYDILSEVTAIALWALYQYLKRGDLDYEFHHTCFVENLE